MGVGNFWSQTPLYNRPYLMNFRQWNYNLLLLSDNGENLSNKQKQRFTFVRMGTLPVLLSNATLLVSKFFAEMLKKRQF
jgi:hypothetical protein